MDFLRAEMQVIIDFLNRQLDIAQGDLSDSEAALEAYNDAIDAQVEAIEILIQATEDHVTAAAQSLAAIQLEIAALEASATIRRLERDWIAAQVLASNELLRTDAEIITAIWAQEAAYQELAGAMGILHDGTLDMLDVLVLLQLGFVDLAATLRDMLTSLPTGGTSSTQAALPAGRTGNVYIAQWINQGTPAEGLEALGVQL